MTYMGGSTRTWVFLAISVYVHCNLLGLVLCQNDLSMIDNYQHAVLKLLDESDSNVISAAILVAV